jgi:hypothetical protein
MKHMKPTNLLLFESLLFTVACKTEDDATIEVHEATILKISVTETAIVDDDVTVRVSFYGPDGCAEPYNIKAEKVGQTVTLRSYYSKSTEDKACTSTLVELSLDYTFFADLPGPYFFISAQNNTVSDTLTVY